MTDNPQESGKSVVFDFSEENLRDVRPFTSAGFALLKQRISEFTNDLVIEANKTSRRHGTDDISGVHVDSAAKYLVSTNAGRKVVYYGTIGGLLVGASLSNALTFINGTPATPISLGITFGLGIVGAFLVALQFAKT